MPTIPINPQTLSEGFTSLGPAAVGQAFDHFVLSLDTQAHLDPAVLATLSIEESLDNGATWVFLSSATRPGGVYYADDGSLLTTMSLESSFTPHAPGLQRRTRFGILLIGGGFPTGGGSCEIT
jgi:hypothetical protein